jgi:ATP-binding cassette subfamily B protein RaxB
MWQNLFITSVNRRVKVGVFDISYDSINRLLFGLENILVIYLAVHLILSGSFSLGMLFAFLAYKSQFLGKATNLVEKFIEFKMLNLHLERLSDVTQEVKEDIQIGSTRAHKIEGHLSMDCVTFSYGGSGRPVIERLSLNVLAGESVALVGPSGCGKSTTLKLMLGLFSPVEGQILVDGLPLEQIGLGQYRRQIAAVMQEDKLLSGSLAQNVSFFDSDIDMDFVMECARMAAIHEDIESMPMGYNSLVGDMGSALSGGQKQRILLARALYKRPKMLFLDEATSHLDTRMESEINSAVRRLSVSRIIIAHRQDTIDSADRVIDLAKAQKRTFN